MKLKDYIESQGKKAMVMPYLASKIGCTRDALRKWSEGERFPRRHNLEAIMKATKGKVTPSDFL
jgi:hypothetical protein